MTSPSFGSAYLLGSGIFAAAGALPAVLWPNRFATYLGYTVAGVSGECEVRSQYGTFFLAVAMVSFLAAMGRLPRVTGYAVNVMAYGGLFAGRLLSLTLDRGMSGWGRTIPALTAIEAVLLACGLWIWISD